MIISDERLIDSIIHSISEYNNQFSKKEDKINYEYLGDNLSINVSEEALSKLETLMIYVKANEVEEEEIQNIIKQLSQILDVMNLKSFSFYMQARGSQYSHIDISFLEHLNDNIERITMSGIDLSNEKPSRFEKFKNLKNFSLEKCNISDPRIISEINPEAFISLKINEIAPEHYKDASKLIQRSNGRIKFSVPELQTIAQIYYTKQAKLSDYLRFMQVTDFDSIPELTVIIGNEIDFENINSKQIINLLNGKTNISLESTPANLLKLDCDGILKVPTKAIVKNASELSVEELKRHQCIATVQISDEQNTEEQQKEPYSRTEYEKVRSEIDSILSQIELPDKEDPNKEKKIFAQIYKILGQRISYDHDAISEEEKGNKRLQITCRNLLGGLLENKCVCAGYADILRNVLACAGIYSEYVSGDLDVDNGVLLTEDSHGHAWNLVRLDGTKYWTDLTFDANNIKVDRYPLPYCLKSTKEFGHDRYTKRPKDKLEDPCLESISDEEQYKLFTGRELIISEKQKNKNIGYLSNCVMSIADSGLTSSMLRETANKLKNPTAIHVIEEEKERE